MEFQKLTKERHSIRAFQARPIEEEKLQAILEAARKAPSAGNLQAYRIHITKPKEKKERLAEAALNQEFVGEAEVVLVFCQDSPQSNQKYGLRGEKLYSLQDATIACAYAQLAAADLGLGTCWVGAFNEEEVSKAIRLPRNLRPIALLPIGYPTEKPFPKSRRSIDELVWKG
jgi:nitroreductase